MVIFLYSLSQNHKLSVADVESGLQNYYQGTAADPYTSQNPKATARPISVYRTQQSHVLQVRSDLPAAIANVEYLELGMTALGIYLPFYQGATIPDNYKLATGKADSDSAYWRFRKVQTLALLNFPKYAPLVQARYAQLNQQISLKQKEFEELYRKEYKKDPLKAKQMLDQFTQATVNEAFLVSDELANQIITDKSDEINKTYKFHGD